MAIAIFRIDKLVPDNFKRSITSPLDFKTFLKKFIRYIETGMVSKADKENLIYSLKLLEELLMIGDLEEQQNLFDQ